MALSQESIDRWKQGGEFSPEDMQMFSEQVGGDTAGMEYWGDDAMNEYAQYLNDQMNEGSKTDIDRLSERVETLERLVQNLIVIVTGGSHGRQ